MPSNDLDVTDQITSHALALAEKAIEQYEESTQQALRSALNAGDLTLCMSMDPGKKQGRVFVLSKDGDEQTVCTFDVGEPEFFNKERLN